jgi:hypothetical protein
MPEGQSPLGVALRVDSTDRIGMALSQSNQLWYWQCSGGCSDPTSWSWTGFDRLAGWVSDADLASDAQNQPHFALRSTGGPFDWGLVHLVCTASCATQTASWTANQVEDTSRLGQDPSAAVAGELPQRRLVWRLSSIAGIRCAG